MRQSKTLMTAGIILLLLAVIIGSVIIYVSKKLAPDGWPVFRCRANLRNLSIWTDRDFENNFCIVDGKAQFYGGDERKCGMGYILRG